MQLQKQNQGFFFHDMSFSAIAGKTVFIGSTPFIIPNSKMT
jgi:hypothetical protein